MALRALVVCPGRGSYGRDQLGSLGDGPIVRWLDAYRAGLGRPTVSALDRAGRFSPRQHLAGEHASLLTFAATAVDLAALDPEKVRVVAVTGNSMGWYTALYAAGALDLAGWARLVETLGAYQAGNVIGGQVLYPLVDEQWRPSAALEDAVSAALAIEGAHLSIRLGGTAVLAGDREAVKRLLAELPPVERAGRTFPLQLPLHSAFHSPLMAETSARALAELADLPLRAPAIPLIGGGGRRFRSWSSPADILDYTLTHQVTAPYDFSAAVRAALLDYAPDVVICPGPGDTMGGPVGQVMAELGWRGVTDFPSFLAAQRSERPPIVAMARPEQRALVA